MTKHHLAIKVKFLPADDQQAVTIADRLGHVLTGLGLEGISGELRVVPYETEDTDPERIDEP